MCNVLKWNRLECFYFPFQSYNYPASLVPDARSSETQMQHYTYGTKLTRRVAYSNSYLYSINSSTFFLTDTLLVLIGLYTYSSKVKTRVLIHGCVLVPMAAFVLAPVVLTLQTSYYITLWLLLMLPYTYSIWLFRIYTNTTHPLSISLYHKRL